MSDAPHAAIDLAAFHADPYPALAALRAAGPHCFVPALGATLFTRAADIAAAEKRVDVFSSVQPEGLMTRLMGQNMMRKDGAVHAAERRAAFPALSPRTVRDHWTARFRAATAAVLDRLVPSGQAELVADFAMPVAGEALRAITGLSGLAAADMDRVSQAMIDGIANYAGDPAVTARCRAAVAEIDRHIDAALPGLRVAPDFSLLSVQMQAGLEDEAVRANVRLAISGGQNEPRDAIAGTAWALLTHPEALARIRAGKATWADAFSEYCRWISPIGMSPRRVARAATIGGTRFDPGDRVFFMFGAGNRDPEAFPDPDRFDITRETTGSLAFGAGPHFCAGAAAARVLVAGVALPMLFDRLPGLELSGDAAFAGWAFRGPLAVPVRW